MDNESFDAFCITYYERIRRYLYSELADPQLALDLTQETKLLQGLRPLYRQAIELRLYQGLSYKTMGERFDEQPDTMRTRVYRGFQELRRKLEAGQDAR
jgi:DNA-directed RNA polymerase specialized sigma24 family protein